MSHKQHLQFILISVSTALVSTMIGQNFVDGIFIIGTFILGIMAIVLRSHSICAIIAFIK